MTRCCLVTGACWVVCAVLLLLCTAACDNDEASDAPAAASRPTPLRDELALAAGAARRGDPAFVMALSSSGRLQRVDLDGEAPVARTPLQLPGKVLLATSNGESLCVVLDTGRSLELQYRSAADPGATPRRVRLDASSDRPPSALHSHGTGCIVALQREIRFVDFAPASPRRVGPTPERSVSADPPALGSDGAPEVQRARRAGRAVPGSDRITQLSILDLPHGRPVRALALAGESLLAFDDRAAPRVVHEFQITRELPRYRTSWTLPASVTGELRAASRVGDDLVLLVAQPDGQDTVLGLRPGCQPEDDGTRHCILWRRTSDAPAPITALLPGSTLTLAAAPHALLTAPLPERPPHDQELDPTALAQPAPRLGTSPIATELTDIRDVLRFGDTLLVLHHDSPQSTALVRARLEGDQLTPLSSTPLPGDTIDLLGRTSNAP